MRVRHESSRFVARGGRRVEKVYNLEICGNLSAVPNVDKKQLHRARGEIAAQPLHTTGLNIGGYICVHAIIVAQPAATFNTR